MASSQRLLEQCDRPLVGELRLLLTVLPGVNLPQQRIGVGDLVVSLAITPAKRSVRVLDQRLRKVELTLIHQSPSHQLFNYGELRTFSAIGFSCELSRSVQVLDG